MASQAIPNEVGAVVLTYRRRRLATQVVRGLIDQEGFDPSKVIVVVNGEGGLDDDRLAQAVEVIELPTNLGPAGGFRVGLEAAVARGVEWVYLCEDDIGLFDLPRPRLAGILERLACEPRNETIGGVVAYGRKLDPRTGRSRPFVPGAGDGSFPEVDVAAWGASLVRCEVAAKGILPDDEWFFGFEDFDFWLKMRGAGYRLVLDGEAARDVADRVFYEQRDENLRTSRPIDAEEPWRRYYEARNFMALRQRHGRASWTRSHVLMTVRRAQLSPTWAHRRAAFHGLWDGLRGRLGMNPRYTRRTGERPHSDTSEAAPAGAVLQVITDNDRRGGQVFASDLHEALAARGLTVRTVALAPASNEQGLQHDVLGPSRRHPRTLFALRAAIAESSVVVAHGSTTLPMCALATLGSSVPFVYRQISEQRFWVNTPGRRVRTRLALSRADHVTALWSGAAEVLTSDFGVPTDKITVVPNGVPAVRCLPVDKRARLAARERFGLAADKPTLLSIGAFVPEKGVDTLVRAMSHPKLAEWQLLLVGAGPERPKLETLARKAPKGSVTIHGPVSSGAEAIAAADVIGLTSRGGDSMPAVLIEAGMMGIPAVATPIEGIVDIVLDGSTGRVVRVDDPIIVASAVADVGNRAEYFGNRAREHCLSKFEIGIVAEQWARTLQRVMS